MAYSSAIAPPVALPNYAIIGQSFAATVNHLTLYHTNSARIAGYQLVHVVGSDTWIHSSKGAIGQWPALIELPGFPFTYRGHSANAFLPAPMFSGCLRRALDMLRHVSPFVEQSGTVARIDRRGAGDYLIVFKDPHTNPLPAARVDVCMGPGVKHWDGSMPRALEREYLAAGDLTSFRRVLCGEDFLGSSASCKGLRVCIVGDGGTAAWVAEQALEREAREVIWLGREFGPRTFLSSGRNDHLVQELERDFIDFYGDRAPYFNWIIKSVVRSAKAELLLIEPFDVESLDCVGNQVLVKPKVRVDTRHPLAPPLPAMPTSEELSRLFSVPFDQVVFAIGGDDDAIAKILQTLFRDPWNLTPSKHALRSSRDKRLLGLQVDNGAVRVLGKAAANLLEPIRRRARDSMPPRKPGPDDFALTLCAQAKGHGLLVAAAVDIAEANDFTEYLVGLPDERAPFWLLETRFGATATEIALARAKRSGPAS